MYKNLEGLYMITYDSRVRQEDTGKYGIHPEIERFSKIIREWVSSENYSFKKVIYSY